MPAPDPGAEPAIVALARSAMQRGLAALTEQDKTTALRWLERAHRLVPQDPNTMLTLASVLIPSDPQRAASLFLRVTERHAVRQAWLGLAAARLRLAESDAALAALATALSCYATTPETIALAHQIAGRNGWCGLRPDGMLEIHPATPHPIQVILDGKPLRSTALPDAWPRARSIEVRCGDAHLLGSPIQVSAIRRLAGCAEPCADGLHGWAWHPNDPDTAPVLTLIYPGGHEQTLTAHDESITIPDTGPLARPRGFRLTRQDLLDLPGPIHIRGPDGRDIPGSPLDPFGDVASHVAAALRIGRSYPAGQGGQPPDDAAASPALRADAPVPRQPVGADGKRRPATVVIPVHDGGPPVLACIAGVLASVPASARVLIVDDGSSDPALVAALDELARPGTITLLRHRQPQGFPASANAGIRAAKGRDVVLLNSDTLVPPNWLERLGDAAYSAPDIGTVTPLSNDASILSYPANAGDNPKPDQAATNRLDRLAARANGAAVIDIPVGVGFCLYLRRDCLNATGAFRPELFAQGYGEENDLCLRARRLGWRNVALTGLFVGHIGGASFGGSAIHLRARNGRIIEQLHPGHQALIDRFLARDPLAEPRRRIDLLQWQQRARAWRQATVLITHTEGGGVEQRLRQAIRTHAAAGRRPIVLRPAETAAGDPAIAVCDGLPDDLPNLVFAMPRELPALLRLLRSARAETIEAHHLAGHPAAIYDLIAQLGLPYDVHVHDYAWLCPRVSLVATDRYCGEPDLRDCEACIADNGHFLKEDIGVAALRTRSAAFLAAADRVVVPVDDVGLRIRRHFPAVATVTVHHENDEAAIQAGASRQSRQQPQPGSRPIICVVGSIGLHKGYDVLLACARDAARRDLDLEFSVVGHTIDDDRLLATGRVFITGQFEPDEAVALIAAQNASLGFVPSICPETWCLSLGDIWRAGLRAAAFDIGAPAERIKRTRHGIVLPLGLSASAINNRLVAAIRATAR